MVYLNLVSNQSFCPALLPGSRTSPSGYQVEEGLNESVMTFSCLTACYLHRRGNDSQTWISLELNWSSWEFIEVKLHSQPYLRRNISSLDPRIFVPRAASRPDLQWIFTPFNGSTTIIEPLLLSGLFSQAMALYDIRVTEWIILFRGRNVELSHWWGTISCFLLNLWLYSLKLKLNSLWDTAQTVWSHQLLAGSGSQ